MLLDTSGLLCLFHAAERQHQAAVAFFDAAPIKITTNYVLAEFVALAHGSFILIHRSPIAAAKPLSSTPHMLR